MTNHHDIMDDDYLGDEGENTVRKPADATYKTIEKNGTAVFLCESCQEYTYGIEAGEYLGERHRDDPEANMLCQHDECSGEV